MNKLNLILLVICNLLVGIIIGWLIIYAGTQAIILALAYIITILVLIFEEML